ncbi:MAG: hypothetical protein R3230_01025 [Nitrosopumilaceae archaeon]|nr:hypothetical protein [Nitrosopumilaceae archaeon]
MNRRISDGKEIYVGHFENIGDLYRLRGTLVKNLFVNVKRMKRLLENQGFMSLICDDMNIEYRIELKEY